MITLTVLAVLFVAIALYSLVAFVLSYGWSLFIIVDLLIAIKILCWIFGSKKKKTN